MRKLLFIIILSLFIPMCLADKPVKIVRKKSCVLVSDYPDKNLNQIKEELLKKVKRMALNEIYGEVIRAVSEVKNFMTINDEVSSRAMGVIRVKGTPEYYNGDSFGELCIKADFFVTEEDMKKFTPKPVIIKNFAFYDPSLSVDKLKSKARKAAYIEIIKRHYPILENLSAEEASKLIHDFFISNEKIDINTGAYTMDIKASIIPVEIELYKNKKKPVIKKENKAIVFKKAKIELSEKFWQESSPTRIKYKWTFKEKNGISAAFNKVRVRVWEGYAGSRKKDKKKLADMELKFEKVYKLNKPFKVPANGAKTIPYTLNKEVISVLKKYEKCSLLHEFIGKDSKGNKIVIEETTVK